jgi:hypothetical protein
VAGIGAALVLAGLLAVRMTVPVPAAAAA